MDKTVEIRPVTPDDWQDFERLFEDRGGPKSCWCMVWRTYARTGDGSDKDARKRGMRDRIGRGDPVGLLAYLDGVPVAWCSVAPRHSFKPSLDGGKAADSTNTWSLTCFYVKRMHRGEGLSDRLIEAAVDYARSQGATELDAYPVAPESPSYRFCGFLAQFERHGFQTVGCVGSRRTIASRTL